YTIRTLRCRCWAQGRRSTAARSEIGAGAAFYVCAFFLFSNYRSFFPHGDGFFADVAVASTCRLPAFSFVSLTWHVSPYFSIESLAFYIYFKYLCRFFVILLVSSL